MNKTKLFEIEELVIDSMTNTGAKDMLRKMYNNMRRNARITTSTKLMNYIRYNIRLGNSTLQSDSELEEIYDLHRYNKRNNIGVKNENESTFTNSKV